MSEISEGEYQSYYDDDPREDEITEAVRKIRNETIEATAKLMLDKTFPPKKNTPYPWCPMPEKCSVSGRCEKEINCGE